MDETGAETDAEGLLEEDLPVGAGGWEHGLAEDDKETAD